MEMTTTTALLSYEGSFSRNKFVNSIACPMGICCARGVGDFLGIFWGICWARGVGEFLGIFWGICCARGVGHFLGIFSGTWM